MTWEQALFWSVAGTFGAAYVASIAAMLGLAIADAIVALWRRLRR